MLDPTPLPFLLSISLAFTVGYLFGSIPFGVLLTRFAGTQDIRTVGSGNIGATNVLRTGRKALAAATLVGDMIKGTVAVLLVLSMAGREFALVAALGAFVGHLFPVWLGFKGGKGVATYIGLLLALSWPVALAFCAIWVAVACVTRYSSLSALVASAATPIALFFVGTPLEMQLFLLLTLALWFRHRNNIRRLVDGTEGRIGAGSAAAPGD